MRRVVLPVSTHQGVGEGPDAFLVEPLETILALEHLLVPRITPVSQSHHLHYILPVSFLSTVAVGVSLIDLMSRVPDQTIEVITELAPGFYHMVRYFDLLLSLLGVGVLPGLTQLPGELLVELLYGSGFAPGGFITDVEAALLLLQSSQIVEICPSLSGVAEPDETLALVVVHLHQDPEVDKTVRVMDQDILPLCEGSRGEQRL